MLCVSSTFISRLHSPQGVSGRSVPTQSPRQNVCFVCILSRGRRHDGLHRKIPELYGEVGVKLRNKYKQTS